ncbi:MAG: hypothetical protein DLM65_02995 [Candidatus Aeolococcus gillhamiae]|uniref:Uncharacterized protein n=1 Tax=Candidatus Aeolococcus gillhamiae TaxID=3127015 RepID=A0A2W5ZJ96_9BACT|nr:MAG: hypothetical protein DLM65_02995 [Candidatus Dormibacter sp. RRmetagenome_bin12]
MGSAPVADKPEPAALLALAGSAPAGPAAAATKVATQVAVVIAADRTLRMCLLLIKGDTGP